jgi:hypothetical protein
MVGFVQQMPNKSKEKSTMKHHHVQCFWAEQETHYDMEKTVSVKTDSDAVKIAVITQQNKIVTDDVSKPEDVEDVQLSSLESNQV